MPKNERGFTLAELMMITTIILLLVSISLVRFMGLREKAADRKTYGNLAALNRSIKIYWSDQGVWPATLDRRPHPDGLHPAFMPEFMNRVLPANISASVPISSDVHDTFDSSGGWVYESDSGRIFINAENEQDFEGKYYTAFLDW